MFSKYLAFDLETAKVPSWCVDDWMMHRPLGISCAATHCEQAKAPVLWYGRKRGEKSPASKMTVLEAKALVKYLRRCVTAGYTIVTWNGIGFDFDVLAEESGMHTVCKSLALGHVDMMFHLLCQCGFGVSLNAAARGMRLTRKCEMRIGATMPRLWADRKYEEVFRHVSRDVRIILDLATTCGERGFLRWITRWGTGRMMRLPNGWQKAGDALTGPEPLLPHEDRRWSRERLTAWMRLIG
jgi:hypothetical protein